MKRVLSIIISLSFFAFIISGCSGEGQSVDGQKEITFEFTQKGSNENWKATNHVSGTYWNIEKVYDITHSIKLAPKKNVTKDEITISVMVDGKLQYYTNKDGSEEINVLRAEKTDEGNYEVTKNLDGFFSDEDDEFWNEKITIIIGQGDEKEEIKLN